MKPLMLMLALAGSSLAEAHDRSWPGQKLAATLPEAANFTQRAVALSPVQQAQVEGVLGEPLRTEDRAPTFYIGTDASSQAVGVVVFLDATGTNGKIEIGESIDPAGHLLHLVLFENSELVAVGKPAFLDAFAGKTSADMFMVGHDIVGPGNGKSAQIIATAARRGLLLAAVALHVGTLPGGAP